MKLVSLKCPECKADLSVEPGRKQCFCQYCGTKIIIDNEEQVQILKTVDEARIREAELDNEIRLRQLEIEKMKLEQEQKKQMLNRLLKIKVSIILGVIGMISILVGYFSKSENPSIFAMCCFVAIIVMWFYSAILDNDKKDNNGQSS